MKAEGAWRCGVELAPGGYSTMRLTRRLPGTLGIGLSSAMVTVSRRGAPRVLAAATTAGRSALPISACCAQDASSAKPVPAIAANAMFRFVFMWISFLVGGIELWLTVRNA